MRSPDSASRRSLRDSLLAQYPALIEDDETLSDTLAGIDDFEEQCLAVLRAALEREAMGKALGEMIDTMQTRRRRLEDGARTMRGAVLEAMQEAGLKSMKAPDMSVSIGAGKPKIVVIDENRIPDRLCRISRTANKIEIASALAAGEKVDGVELGNPQPFLIVHRR